MSGFGYNPRMAAYRSTLVHGGVASSDPHALVQMLFDAAVDRMAAARGCIERGDQAGNAKLLHSCVIILTELRGSLDLTRGGPLATNLRDLYEYMIRRLMLANARADAACITEVLGLLGEIRSAWVAIRPQVQPA